MNANQTTHVLLAIQPNRGYAADQIDSTVTLGELLESVENAIEQFGTDAQVVLKEGGRYGALFGALPRWTDLFSVEDDDDEDDYL